MTDDRYDRVTFRGVTVDKYTRAALLAVEKDLGYELTIWQGSYHKGVSKSAGTHDGGGVVDLNGYYDATNKVKALRRHGFVADLRNQPSLSMEIHAVQIGNEKVAPSAKAQIAPMIRGEAGLARRVSQVIKYTPPGGYKAFKYTTTPPPPPKPVKVYDAWFKLGEWNLSGFDVVFGKAQWDALEDKKVAEIAALDCDIWCLLEIPNGKLAQFTKKLGKVGLKVVGGTDGRYIVAKNSVKVGRVKTVTLSEKGPANDDKQIVIAELWPEDGAPVIIECGHLEYREGARADKARVTQAKQVKQVTLEFAKTCKVPVSRVFFANDENSEAMVSRDAFGSDWPDVFDTAAKSTSAMWRSLVGWSGKYVRGARIDKVHAHTSRPIVAAKLNTSTARKKISDHIPTVVTVGSL